MRLHWLQTISYRTSVTCSGTRRLVSNSVFASFFRPTFLPAFSSLINFISLSFQSIFISFLLLCFISFNIQLISFNT